MNLALLLGVATLPFPTALLAEYVAVPGPSASTAAVIYGALSVLTALPWTFMWRRLARHPELLEPPFDQTYARAELKRGGIGPVIYALAIPIALVAPLVSIAFYIGIGLPYAFTNQGVSEKAYARMVRRDR